MEEVTGVSISEMEEMLSMMKGCKFGAIYVGLGIASSYGKHRNAELAFNLVKELNGYTKFVIGALQRALQCGRLQSDCIVPLRLSLSAWTSREDIPTTIPASIRQWMFEGA